MIKSILSFILVSAMSFAQAPGASTTVARETANNTSAASTFVTSPNGNLKAGNVSKVNVHTLSGNIKVFAHMVPWWGSPAHANIGYSLTDPAQVHREIEDMVSHGIDGIAVTWYGKSSYEDKSMLLLKPEVEAHPGFEFMMLIEAGSVRWYSACFKAGACTATQAIIQHLNYVQSTYLTSSHYMVRNGKYVVGEFGMEVYSPDWNAIQAAFPKVSFVHRNANGFLTSASAGAFGWLEPKTPDVEPAGYNGLAYLQYVNKIAVTRSGQMYISDVYKGFNDVGANWSPKGGRHIEQNCGQTWLDTWKLLKSYTGTNIHDIELVTWDDYEEGTELQTGIDNCMSITAAVSNSMLSWVITGNEATVDHYTVFLSTDGQNLMPIQDVPSGTHQLDLAPLQLAPGTYQLFVKAVGLPLVLNHLSAAASMVMPALDPTESLVATMNGPILSVTGMAATANPGDKITGMIVYVDSLSQKTVLADNISATLLLPLGSHQVTLNAWNIYGKFVTKTVTVVSTNPSTVQLLQ